MSFFEGLQHIGRILQAADQDPNAQHNVMARQQDEHAFTAGRDKSLAEITAQRDKALADLEKARAEHANQLQALRDKNLHGYTVDTIKLGTDETLRGEQGRLDQLRDNLIKSFGPVVGMQKFQAMQGLPASDAEAKISTNALTTAGNAVRQDRIGEIVGAQTNAQVAGAARDTMKAQNELNEGMAVQSTVGDVARAKQEADKARALTTVAQANVDKQTADAMGGNVPRWSSEQLDATNAQRQAAGLPPTTNENVSPIIESIRNNAGLNRSDMGLSTVLNILRSNPILGQSILQGTSALGGVGGLPSYSPSTVPNVQKRTPVQGGKPNFDFSGAK